MLQGPISRSNKDGVNLIVIRVNLRTLGEILTLSMEEMKIVPTKGRKIAVKVSKICVW